MKIKKLFLFPIFLGIYPVLNLFVQNIIQIQAFEGIRSIIVSLLFSILIYFLIYLLIKDSHVSALITTLFLLLFFAYGHLYLYFSENNFFGVDLSRIRYLLPINIAIFFFGSWLILKFKKKFEIINPTLKIFSIIILVFPLFQIVQFIWNQNYVTKISENYQLSLPNGKTPPDIYLIVLDGYSRGDVLQDYFGYDNLKFLRELSDEGFYIAQCSQANYSWTLPSMASTLNMMYLNQNFGSNEIAFSDNEMYSLIKNNRVRELLENLGYSTVAFENGFNWLHWYDADIYYSPIGDEEGYLRLNLGLNSFELLFVETTALRIIMDLNLITNPNQANNFSEILSNPREIHRQRINYIFEKLPYIGSLSPGPKFIYAHIVSPHDPYIFGPQGESLSQDPDNINQAYIDQLNYINGQIVDLVQKIKIATDNEAIIIIQSDHGAPIEWAESDQNEKLGILNSIYYPNGNADEILYESLSPVNNFRLIFNEFFNANFEILPDKSIFGWQSPEVDLPCEKYIIDN